MPFFKLSALLLVLMSLLACGSDEELAKGNHVWKEQTKAIDKAKEVEKMLQQRAMQHMQKADEQSE